MKGGSDRVEDESILLDNELPPYVTVASRQPCVQSGLESLEIWRRA